MAHIVCLLSVESDRATFTWSEGPASFEPYQLADDLFVDFQDIAKETRKRLRDLVKDYMYNPENVPAASLSLAQTGHEMYLQIFDPGASPPRVARDVRTWLENLRDQLSVDSLEIALDCTFGIPWNCVYDQPPDKQAFLSSDASGAHWQPFWGRPLQLVRRS